jgi:hypothetical protein
MLNNIFIYLIYVGVSIVIFLIDSYLGLLLIVFSYLLLFFLNYKKNGTIFNYIQFYLLSCWILSLSRVFNAYSFKNGLFYEEKLYVLYCIIITGIISIFFKLPNKNFYLFEKKLNEINFRNFYPLLIIILLLLIFSLEGSFGGIVKYIVQNLLFISPIFVASILYLNFKKNKIFPNIIFLIVFIYYTSTNFNRTGFLIVPLIYFTTILINKNFQFNLKKNFNFIFASIAFFFIIFVVGDLYKTSTTRNLLDFAIEFKFNDLFGYFSETRYKVESAENIYDYFHILDVLTDEHRELGGNIFSQFINIFKPRYFFPLKEITNISQLNQVQGIIENPLYFAIFMESTYNLGLPGVFAYHFFILLIGYLMFRTLTIVENKFLFQLFSLNYYFYIIYIFILIRGPGIHFASYFLICFLFMCYYLYKTKKTALKVNDWKN